MGGDHLPPREADKHRSSRATAAAHLAAYRCGVHRQDTTSDETETRRKHKHSPRHQLLQQKLALRLAARHARPRCGSRRRGYLGGLDWAHGRNGLRVGGGRGDGPKKRQESVLPLGGLVAGTRHVRRNRASVPGRWGRGPRVRLLLGPLIDSCARNARLRANMRSGGRVQIVEKGVEVGLGGVRCGDLAVGRCWGDMGLAGRTWDVRDHLELRRWRRCGGPARKDVISDDGIHGGQSRRESRRTRPRRGVKGGGDRGECEERARWLRSLYRRQRGKHAFPANSASPSGQSRPTPRPPGSLLSLRPPSPTCITICSGATWIIDYAQTDTPKTITCTQAGKKC